MEESDSVAQGESQAQSLETDSSGLSSHCDSKAPSKALTLVRSVLTRRRQAVQVRTPASSSATRADDRQQGLSPAGSTSHKRRQDVSAHLWVPDLCFLGPFSHVFVMRARLMVAWCFAKVDDRSSGQV